MNADVLLSIQFLHILFGAIYLGGFIYIHFVLWPTLLSRPSAEAKGFYGAVLKKTTILMGSSLGMTFLLGITLGIGNHQINSLESLGTKYGITYLIALLANLVLLLQGPGRGPALLNKIWNGNQFVPDAAKTVKKMYRSTQVAIGVILICMILMVYGL